MSASCSSVAEPLPAELNKKQRRETPAKRWCFTINNPTDTDREQMAIHLVEDRVEYAIVGLEKGHDGTPHYQGFVNWKTKIRMSLMKLRFPRADLELAKGNDEQNKTYCSKEGNIYLAIGVPSAQGKRNDLTAAVETLHACNGDFQELARACPNQTIRYGRGLREYWMLVGSQPRVWKTIVGPPACGKSRVAFDMGWGVC